MEKNKQFQIKFIESNNFTHNYKALKNYLKKKRKKHKIIKRKKKILIKMGPVFSDYFQEELKKRFQWDETKVEEEKGGFVLFFVYLYNCQILSNYYNWQE